jgi:hypothetical protein
MLLLLPLLLLLLLMMWWLASCIKAFEVLQLMLPATQ